MWCHGPGSPMSCFLPKATVQHTAHHYLVSSTCWWALPKASDTLDPRLICNLAADVQSHEAPSSRSEKPLPGCRRALLEAGAPLPGGLLLCGPPGCGKSSLLRLVGDALRTQTDCQAHVVFISCRTVTADGWDALHKHLTPLVRLVNADDPRLEGPCCCCNCLGQWRLQE